MVAGAASRSPSGRKRHITATKTNRVQPKSTDRPDNGRSLPSRYRRYPGRLGKKSGWFRLPVDTAGGAVSMAETSRKRHGKLEFVKKSTDEAFDLQDVFSTHAGPLASNATCTNLSGKLG